MVILVFFALPIYDAKIKRLKAYIHIFMNGLLEWNVCGRMEYV